VSLLKFGFFSKFTTIYLSKYETTWGGEFGERVAKSARSAGFGACHNEI
jgi:hypothetical protein